MEASQKAEIAFNCGSSYLLTLPKSRFLQIYVEKAWVRESEIQGVVEGIKEGFLYIVKIVTLSIGIQGSFGNFTISRINGIKLSIVRFSWSVLHDILWQGSMNPTIRSPLKKLIRVKIPFL